MATEAVEIALRLLLRKRKLLRLLHPFPRLLRPCCLYIPSRTWTMGKEGKRRFGCLCSDTCTEPSCWPAWLSVRPGTSGTSHPLIRRTKQCISFDFLFRNQIHTMKNWSFFFFFKRKWFCRKIKHSVWNSRIKKKKNYSSLNLYKYIKKKSTE